MECYIYIYTMPAIIGYPLGGILRLILGVFHLWYISALILAVILYFFLMKFIKKKMLFILAILLFAVGYFIQYYCSMMDDLDPIQLNLFRNGLFFGLPLFTIGNLLFSFKTQINEKIKTNYLIYFLLFSVCVFGYEIYLHYQKDIMSDLYLSLLILCPSLFLLILRYSKNEISDGFIGKLSESIYFVHPLAMNIVFGIFSFDYSDGYKSVVLPLVIFISMLLSVGIIQLNKHIKILL